MCIRDSAQAQRRSLSIRFEEGDLRTHRERAGSLAGILFTYDVYSFLADREERIAMLRRNLPTSLSVARLRRAVAELARLETMGELREGANGDGAKSLVLRLGRAVDELEILLREVQSPG